MKKEESSKNRPLGKRGQKPRIANVTVYDKAPFNSFFQRVVKFPNLESMNTYFSKDSRFLHKLYHAEKATRLPHTGAVVLKGKQEFYQGATYMRFKNEDDGLTYYCFILATEYNNNGSTAIIFEVDPFNTYQHLLFTQPRRGFVSQATPKRKTGDGKTSFYNTTQGFNVGLRHNSLTEEIPPELYWMVLVAKPSIKITDSDNLQGKPSIPATFSGFRKFIAPINKNMVSTEPFIYNGKQYPRTQLTTLVDEITNRFNDGENTVNQAVNLYNSKFIGLSYRKQGGWINIDDIDEAIVWETGQGGGTGPDPEPGAPDPWGGIDWDGDLHYEAGTIHEDQIKRLIGWCRKYHVLPQLVIVLFALETQFGATNDGSENNNWTDIDYPGWLSGVNIAHGNRENKVKYDSWDDGFQDQLFGFRDSAKAENAGSYYDVAYKDMFITIDIADIGRSASSGLWMKYSGANNNWKANDPDSYLIKMGTASGTIALPTVWDRINANVVKNGQWIEGGNDGGSGNWNAALGELEKVMGTTVNNGECYGLAAYYVDLIGGPTLMGSGKISAAEIPNDYDWASFGWSVSPPGSMPKIGDVISWKPFSGPAITQYGHVAVCYAIENGRIYYYEQNGVAGRIVAKSSIADSTIGDLSGCITPPV